MDYRRMERSDRAAMEDFFSHIGELGTAFFDRDGENKKHTMAFFDGGSRNYEYSVLVENGQILGYTFLWDLGKSVPWFGICLREDQRGRHLGTQMLKATLDDLKKRGYGGLLLTTDVANLPGQALYEKCGFEKLGMHLSCEYLYLYRFEETKQ